MSLLSHDNQEAGTTLFQSTKKINFLFPSLLISLFLSLSYLLPWSHPQMQGQACAHRCTHMCVHVHTHTHTHIPSLSRLSTKRFTTKYFKGKLLSRCMATLDEMIRHCIYWSFSHSSKCILLMWYQMKPSENIQ